MLCLLDRERHLPLFERRVFGSECDHDTLRSVAFGFAVGMEPCSARKRLNASELDSLTALPADAGLNAYFLTTNAIRGTVAGTALRPVAMR